MKKTKRLVAVALAILMLLGTLSTAALAWDATVDDGFALSVSTKILRQVDGEWIETEKVKQGEQVKARVYLNTDYYSNAGNLLFFYNSDFFTDSFGTSYETLTVNSYYSNSPYGITGKFYGSQSRTTIEQDMVDAGRITADFAATHDFVYIGYYFNANSKNQKFNGNYWFCEIPLTVKSDAVGTGDFFAVEETTCTPDFTFGAIDVPKGQASAYNESVVSMSNWTATINYTSQPVTLFTNFVSSTLDTAGGKFADGTTSKVIEGDAGDPVTVEAPTKTNYRFLGWRAKGTSDAPAQITAYPAANTEYEAVWESTTASGETLTFRTEIYRKDPVTGEWIFTEKVKPGEIVKARLFIDTTYFTNGGDIILFYDQDFFTDAYTLEQSQTLVTNTDASSSAGATNATGDFTRIAPSNRILTDLVDYGYITDEFASTHSAITLIYQFNPTKGSKLSGDEWFAEFDLQVRSTASGEGDFFIVPETIQNSGAGSDAYINVPLSTDGGDISDVVGMFLWDVNPVVESNPVSTYSSVTFRANGGSFSTGDPNEYVVNGDIGDAIDAAAIPEVTKAGSAFIGWVDASIENPTVSDVVEIPATIPYDDTVLKALWIDEIEITYNLNNGEPDVIQTVTAGDAFVVPETPSREGHYFVNWSTDPTGAVITGLPANYPLADTTYYAIFEPSTYNVSYYVLNPETLEFNLVAEARTAYGDKIVTNPASYTPPEGYSLSVAYTDVTFKTPLAADATMPANNVSLYYKLKANAYDAVFYVDGAEYASVPTAYGDVIKAPADPTKEGYEFVGWEPEVSIMDAEGKVFNATWAPVEYTAVYNVDGQEYESYQILFGEDVDVPADPEKVGYTFEGWTPSVPATMPAENLTFDAVFTANTYDAVFEADGGYFDGDKTVTSKTVPTVYNTDIEAPAAPVKQGYVFSGWDPTVGTMDTEGKTFTAVWAPADDTPYTVEIYTMDTAGAYGTPDVINKTGTTDKTVEVTPSVAEGFYVDTAKSVLSAAVAPDGSTVLKVYYARKTYTIGFYAMGGTIDGNPTSVSTYYHGATVVAPTDPVREGYTFKGWNPGVATVAVGDATYQAQWTINQYTITFDTDGGSEIAPITQDYATDITPPEDPTKLGYEFTGWDAEVPATMPAGDITLTAQWNALEFDSNFYKELDDADPYQTTASVFGTPVIEPDSDPTKTGYEFLGWSTDGQTVIADLGTMDEEGKTFYAVWTPADVDYTVEHYYMTVDMAYPAAADRVDSLTAKTESTVTAVPDTAENFTVDASASVLEAVVAADGTTVLKVYYVREVNKLTVNVDGTVTEVEYPFEAPVDPVADPEKEGYTFNGWVDGNGDPTTVPATMPGDNVEIIASWTVNSYDVTYIVDDTVYYGPTATDFGAAIPAPTSAPTKAGYVFGGWFDADGKQPTDYGTMPAKDLEFTAKWAPNANVGYVLEVYQMETDGTYSTTPTMVFNYNDGVVGDERTASVTVPAGFTLDTVNSVLTGTIPATGTLTLKAFFARNQHKLTVVVDGVETDYDYYYNATVTPVADPEKAGYTFTGWVDENGDAAKVPVVMPDKDVKVIAQWAKNSLNAVFDAGEGVFESTGNPVETIEVAFGEAIVAPAEIPVRDGFEFGGWATSEAPNIPVTDFGTMDADGAEFIAIWTATDFTVTFKNYHVPAEGAAIVKPEEAYDYATGTYKLGEEIVFPAEAPTFNEHHTFLGWSTVEGDANSIVTSMTMPAENVTLYAVYERVKVMLIPKNDTCTTVIDRAGGTVDDYEDGVSEWYVYGLKDRLREEVLLSNYIDVQGDGRIEIEYVKTPAGTTFEPYTGTGTKIKVYDNVTNELVESFYIIIYGDVNGDSRINSTDASAIKDEAVGITDWSIKNSSNYVAYKFKAANIRADRFITTNDASLVKDFAIGLTNINQVTGEAGK